MMKSQINRNRIWYILLFAGAIAAGLLSRSKYISLPKFISEYSGDTIWAMMVYFLFCSIFTKWKTLHIFILAIIFSYAIEFSQLYHADWIDQIRRYRIGGLILGFGFKFSDLVCYTVGIGAGAIIDIILNSSKTKK